MFMKAQLPTGRGRCVSACAAHGNKAPHNKTAAVLLGAALQVAVLSHAPAEAFSLPTDAQKAIDEQIQKIEAALDGPDKLPGSEAVKQANEQGYAASAQQGIEEAGKRAAQEAAKADQAGEALGKAETEAEKKAGELARKASQAKAAAEEATKDKLAAIKDAAGKFGSAKTEAQKVVDQKTSAENDALKAASDAKVAAEEAIAEVVATADQGMSKAVDSFKP